ncbi:MAG: HesA/MoeB/ThiF family protein, partial [Psychrobium sp.]|nr:HesA/MoeB/ThiF family protein [Psychrobium sp.]
MSSQRQSSDEKPLNDEQFMRYSRQIMLPEWGEQGQKILANVKVLIVGCGGLGTLAASYLAGAGIGHLVLVDDDEVTLSNLPRQLSYDMDSLDNAKVFELSNRLQEQNPHCWIEPIFDRFSEGSAPSLLKNVDLLLDCSDNMTTRYLINEQCINQQVPLLSGS